MCEFRILAMFRIWTSWYQRNVFIYSRWTLCTRPVVNGSLTRSIKQTFPVHQYFDPTLSPWWRIMMPVSQLLHIGNNVTFEIDSVILKELFSNEYWLNWNEMKPTSTTLPSAFLFIFNCPADSSTVTSSMTLAHWATFDLWTSIDNPLVVRELPNLIHDNLCELTLDSIRNSFDVFMCLWFLWDNTS